MGEDRDLAVDVIRSKGPVYAIIQPSDDWQERMKRLAQNGVRLFQLRSKGIDDRRALDFAVSASAMARSCDALLIINDRFDIALLAGADGVHLGSEDLPPGEVRRCWPDAVIGVTVRDPISARQAVDAGADYLGTGPVFPSPSKPHLRVLGIDGLRRVTEAAARPIVAIGGIMPAAIPQMLSAGAAAVAMITGLKEME